ncbi:uncharacterized protein LOC108671486 isoform X2 [Hyalella azteca]|uniref:Uncharacterized protein LOC108671486 isoform X2 n=1 Tax=Hyalella azteca TaxID=294128 RepID=A0A8B7NLI3_HYAAZ|nr:uncharacterized protein LOC108671486 isoform X2 [Hyalella azteca]
MNHRVMESGSMTSSLPLYLGRSFVCYRDVNKAIDQHRELFGLKLTLKKSVKLENSDLTAEQIKHLNHRLKYGVLDYNCTIDNGRVGRPGNDERCDLSVSLRINSDGTELVVQDTHIHEFNNKKGFGKAVPTPTPNVMAMAPLSSTRSIPKSDSEVLTDLSSSLNPALLAASLAAAAAAAAGPSALSPQACALLNLPNMARVACPVKSNPVTNDFSQPAPSVMSSTPAPKSATLQTLGKSSSTPMMYMSVASPLPGQLLIPSFYSSKSPSGNITFNSTGSRNSPMISNSARTNLISSKPHFMSTSSSNANTTANAHLLLHSNNPTLPGSRPPGQEKLTMKFKKSQFSPNEMVVVGSARDALERQDYQQVDRVTPKTHTKKTPGYGPDTCTGGRIKAVIAHLLEKVNNSNNSLSITQVLSPIASSKPKSQSLLLPKQTKQSNIPTSSAPAILNENPGTVLLAGRLVPAGITLTPASSSAPAAIQTSQVPGKQQTAAPPASYNIKRLQDKIRAEKAEKAAMKVKAKSKQLSYLHSNKPPRSVGRPVGSTNSARVSTKISNYTDEKVAGALISSSSKAALSGTQVNRKMRKCRQRPGPVADGSSVKQQRAQLDNPDKLLPIDTELGENTKQRLAQRALVQLLRTVTRLPMVQFCHAMDTFATLNDALRLKQRVELSLRSPQSDDGSFTLLGCNVEDDLSISQKRRRMLEQVSFADSDLKGAEGLVPLADTSDDVVVLASSVANKINAQSEVIDLVDDNISKQKLGVNKNYGGENGTDKRKHDAPDESSGNKRSKES